VKKYGDISPRHGAVNRRQRKNQWASDWENRKGVTVELSAHTPVTYMIRPDITSDRRVERTRNVLVEMIRNTWAAEHAQYFVTVDKIAKSGGLSLEEARAEYARRVLSPWYDDDDFSEAFRET